MLDFKKTFSSIVAAGLLGSNAVAQDSSSQLEPGDIDPTINTALSERMHCLTEHFRIDKKLRPVVDLSISMAVAGLAFLAITRKPGSN